uniref:RAI1-like domain-containing protein n=1 Tax=Tetranychus urticae TaxID=32264 RepID=T1KE41_TETUR
MFFNLLCEDYEVVYCPDNSSLKYIVSTELDEPFKAAAGYSPESDTCALACRWSDFMRWINENDEIIKGLTHQGDQKQQIDFICSTMELKFIMLSCYEANDWVIHAYRTRREIFLYLAEKNIIEDKVESKPQYNPMKTNKMSYAILNVIRKITKAVEERATNSNTVTDILSAVSLSTIGQHRILHNGFTEFVMSKEDASAMVSGVKTLIYGDLDGDFTLRKLDVLPAIKGTNMVYEFHLDAETREVIVSPSEKPIEDYGSPWYVSGDTPDEAKS